MVSLAEQAVGVFNEAYKVSEGNLRLAGQTTRTFIAGSREQDKLSAYGALRKRVGEVVTSFFSSVRPDSSFVTRANSPPTDLGRVEFDADILATVREDVAGWNQPCAGSYFQRATSKGSYVDQAVFRNRV